MVLEIHVLAGDRHKYVVGLNQLMRSQRLVICWDIDHYCICQHKQITYFKKLENTGIQQSSSVRQTTASLDSFHLSSLNIAL